MRGSDTVSLLDLSQRLMAVPCGGVMVHILLFVSLVAT